jgi:hypothetical protein
MPGSRSSSRSRSKSRGRRRSRSRPNNRSRANATACGPSWAIHRQPSTTTFDKRKWVDVNWYLTSTSVGVAYGSSSVITSGGSYYQVAALGEGSDRTMRIGRAIAIHAFEIQAHVEAAQETLLFSGDYNNTIRFFLIRPNATILPNSSTTASILPVGDPITGLFDADDVDEVYFDKTITVQTQLGPGPSGSGTASYTNYAGTFRRRVVFNPPLSVEYNGNNANSVSSPGLLLGVVSDSNATPNPSASCSFRMVFSDA